MFSTYPTSIYYKKFTTSETPRITTDLGALEARAREQLPPPNYWYAAGGCSLETTMKANREAFDEYRIIPRALRQTNTEPDLERTLFGRRVTAPLVMAPIGAQRVYHPMGDIAVSKAFGKHNIPFTLSTYASHGLEEVAKANGDNPRWFQLYMPRDEDITRSILERAKQQGYEVLVLTIDTWAMAWRPHDLETGFLPFLDGVGTSIWDNDPACVKKLGFDSSVQGATKDQMSKAALHMLGQTGDSPTWDKVKFLREVWGDKPIVIKGIQSVADAKLAVKYGVDGIVVSNHGGRQVDGAIGSLQALRRIVDAVGDKLSVGFDSGIRCGADIFKAVALGADYVMIGRPVVWGLAIDGETGVDHVLDCLIADLKLHVCLTGCKSITEVTREMLAERNGEPLVPESKL